MKVLKLSTQLHKWIALVVGLQVLFWVGGGLVMVTIPIETVRSEHRVAEQTPVPLALAALPSLNEIARQAGVAPVQADLRGTPRGLAWTLKPAEGEPVIVSALTGRPFGPLTAAEASGFAKRAYKGTAEVSGAVLLQEAPQETGRTGPLWRVDFADRKRAVAEILGKARRALLVRQITPFRVVENRSIEKSREPFARGGFTG